MKTLCKNCLNPTTIPGIKLNENGICNMCELYANNMSVNERYRSSLEKKMNNAILKAKDQKNIYDAAVLFSGGKDSTYTINLVKNQFNMKILAISIIHPFINDVARSNIDDVCRILNVEHIKYYVDENIYKKLIKYCLEVGYKKYNLNEFAGCHMCGFIYKWISFKLACMLHIPILFDGNISSQGGGVIDGNDVKNSFIRYRKKPFGIMHDLVQEVLENDAGILGFDEEEMLKYNFPTRISPLKIMDYKEDDSMAFIKEMGLDICAFHGLHTNCSVVPLFDYYAYCRYNTFSYTQIMSNELRTQNSYISSLYLSNKKIEREKMLEHMKIYKKLIMYVHNNNLTISDKTQINKKDLYEIAAGYSDKEQLYEWIDKIICIQEHAKYLNLDLDNISDGIYYE